VALLLRHSLGLEAEALQVEAAVRAAIAGGARTADIADIADNGLSTPSAVGAGGQPPVLSTRQMGDAVLQAFAALS
jgi:isocitrate/isopropylmalate dehydrogenase